MKKMIIKYKVDIAIIFIMIVLSLIWSFYISILYINGDSMYPTLENNEVLFLKKDKNMSIGNIVVFNPPESWGNEKSKFIKRIIASEGDEIIITNDELYVNDELVADIKPKRCNLEKEAKFTIDSNKFLMVGDNYAMSNDSIAQLCNGNDDFLIEKENIIFSGNKLFSIKGGIFN